MQLSDLSTNTESALPPMGICRCGCGRPTPIATATRRARGQVKGQPTAYVSGHRSRAGEYGVAHHSAGYIRRRRPEHPRADVNGYVFEHVLVVEAALGHYLRPTAPVHHVDEHKPNNAPTNLVACHDTAYHKLLHKRQRAFDACGDANALRCFYCCGYDRQDEMIRIKASGKNRTDRGVHRSCNAKHVREFNQARRPTEIAAVRRLVNIGALSERDRTDWFAVVGEVCRPAAGWPGGTVGKGVPAFNAANIRKVERSNAAAVGGERKS